MRRYTMSSNIQAFYTSVIAENAGKQQTPFATEERIMLPDTFMNLSNNAYYTRVLLQLTQVSREQLEALSSRLGWSEWG